MIFPTHNLYIHYIFVVIFNMLFFIFFDLNIKRAVNFRYDFILALFIGLASLGGAEGLYGLWATFFLSFVALILAYNINKLFD